jgi:hypothetical protein
MTEHALQQCKPAKRPCITASPEHQNVGGRGEMPPQISYTASLLAAPIYSYETGPLDFGDVQVMGTVNHATSFANPKSDAKVEAQMTLARELTQPMTPPTPGSMTSDTGDHMTTLTVDVDLCDTAIVPASILTPDSTPVPSPEQALSPAMDVKPKTEIEDLSFFDNIEMKKPKEETKLEDAKGLPVLDLLSIEDYLTAMESPKPRAPQLKVAPQSQPQQPNQEALLTMNDELARFVSEAMCDFRSDEQFMLVPEQSQSQQPATGDASIMSELKQLTEVFINSPSYGKSQTPPSPYDSLTYSRLFFQVRMTWPALFSSKPCKSVRLTSSSVWHIVISVLFVLPEGLCS